MKKLTLEVYHYQLTVVVAVIMMLYGITNQIDKRGYRNLN